MADEHKPAPSGTVYGDPGKLELPDDCIMPTTLPCGHPLGSVVTGTGGTSYCCLCEAEAMSGHGGADDEWDDEQLAEQECGRVLKLRDALLADMTAQRDEAGRERDEARAILEVLRAQLIRCNNVWRDAIAQRDTLMALAWELLKEAWHLEGCPKRYDKSVDCTCGLDALLARFAAVKGEVGTINQEQRR